jgi:isopenicillin N synthase-like dioxygenase
MSTETLLDQIPSLDLFDYTKGDTATKEKFVSELGAAFNTIGFVAIKNHGLSEEHRLKLYETIQKFFFLEDTAKQKYEFPELSGQRGYIGKNKEKAKGFTKPDLKEFYHIGQPNQRSYMPNNVFPSEVADFEKLTVSTFQIFEETGKTLLQAIAEYLDLDKIYFDEKIYQGDSILRALHYFPILDPESLPEGAVRAAAHGDINLITLLMGASAEGLEVLRVDGKWIQVTALPDQIIINVGDMLDRLTNHKLKSTIHRVVNPPREKMGTSRFSIPFFMHPRGEMDLTCLESCISTENPKIYTDMTAGAFLEERLIELGLKKV